MATLPLLASDVGRLQELIGQMDGVNTWGPSPNPNPTVAASSATTPSPPQPANNTTASSISPHNVTEMMAASLQWNVAGAFMNSFSITNLPASEAVIITPTTNTATEGGSQDNNNLNTNNNNTNQNVNVKITSRAAAERDHILPLLHYLRTTPNAINTISSSSAASSSSLTSKNSSKQQKGDPSTAGADGGDGQSSPTPRSLGLPQPQPLLLGAFPSAVSYNQIVASTIRPMALHHEASKVAIAHVRHKQFVALRQWRAAREAAEARRKAALTAHIQHAGLTTFTDLTMKAKPEALLFAVSGGGGAAEGGNADGSARGGDAEAAAALLEEQDWLDEYGGSDTENSNGGGSSSFPRGGGLGAFAGGGGSDENEADHHSKHQRQPSITTITNADGTMTSILNNPTAASQSTTTANERFLKQKQHDFIVESDAKVRLQSEKLRQMLPPKMSELSAMIRSGAGATSVALLLQKASSGAGAAVGNGEALNPSAAQQQQLSDLPQPTSLKPAAITAAAQIAAASFNDFSAMSLSQQQKAMATENLRNLVVSDENKEIVAALTRPEPVLTLTPAAIRSLFAKPPVTFVAAGVSAPLVGVAAGAGGADGEDTDDGLSNGPAGLVSDTSPPLPSSLSSSYPIPTDDILLLAQLEEVAATVASLLLEGSQVVVGVYDKRGNGGGEGSGANNGGGGNNKRSVSTSSSNCYSFFNATVSALRAAISEKISLMRPSLLQEAELSNSPLLNSPRGGGGATSSRPPTPQPSGVGGGGSGSVLATGQWRAAVATRLDHLQRPLILSDARGGSSGNLSDQLNFAFDDSDIGGGWKKGSSSTTTESLIDFLSLSCTDRVAASIGNGQVLEEPTPENTNTTTTTPNITSATTSRRNSPASSHSPFGNVHHHLNTSHSSFMGGGGGGGGVSPNAFPTPRAAASFLRNNHTTAAVMFCDLDSLVAEAVADRMEAMGRAVASSSSSSTPSSSGVSNNKKNPIRNQNANVIYSDDQQQHHFSRTRPTTPKGIIYSQYRNLPRAVVSATPLAVLLQITDAVIVCGPPTAATVVNTSRRTMMMAMTKRTTRRRRNTDSSGADHHHHVTAASSFSCFIPHLIAALARSTHTKSLCKLHHKNRSGGPSTSASSSTLSEIPSIPTGNMPQQQLSLRQQWEREREVAMVSSLRAAGLGALVPMHWLNENSNILSSGSGGEARKGSTTATNVNSNAAASSSAFAPSSSSLASISMSANMATTTSDAFGGYVGLSSFVASSREQSELVKCILSLSSSSSASAMPSLTSSSSSFLILGDSDGDLTLFASSLASNRRHASSSSSPAYFPCLLEVLVSEIEAKAASILSTVRGAAADSGSIDAETMGERGSTDEESLRVDGRRRRQQEQQHQRQHDALTRYLLSIFLRSAFSHIFVAGKAAPMLKTLCENRIIYEEFTSSPSSSSSPRSSQAKHLSNIPQLPIPQNIPPSLLKSCNLLLDVVGTANVRGVDEELEEADDDTAGEEEERMLSVGSQQRRGANKMKTNSNTPIPTTIPAADATTGAPSSPPLSLKQEEEEALQAALGLIHSFLGPKATTSISDAFRGVRGKRVVVSGGSEEGEGGEEEEASTAAAVVMPTSAEAIRQSLEPYPFDELRRKPNTNATGAVDDVNAADADSNGRNNNAEDDDGEFAGDNNSLLPVSARVETLKSIFPPPALNPAPSQHANSSSPSTTSAANKKASSSPPSASQSSSSSPSTAAATLETLLCDWLATGIRSNVRSRRGHDHHSNENDNHAVDENVSSPSSSSSSSDDDELDDVKTNNGSRRRERKVLMPSRRRPLTLLLPSDVIVSKITLSGKVKTDIRPLLGPRGGGGGGGGGRGAVDNNNTSVSRGGTANGHRVAEDSTASSSPAKKKRRKTATVVTDASSSAAAVSEEDGESPALEEEDALNNTRAGVETIAGLMGDNDVDDDGEEEAADTSAINPPAVGGDKNSTSLSLPSYSAVPAAKGGRGGSGASGGGGGVRLGESAATFTTRDSPAFSIYWYPEEEEEAGEGKGGGGGGKTFSNAPRNTAQKQQQQHPLMTPSRYRYVDLGPETVAALLRWTIPKKKSVDGATQQGKALSATPPPMLSTEKGEVTQKNGNQSAPLSSSPPSSSSSSAIAVLGNITLSLLHEMTYDEVFPPMPSLSDVSSSSSLKANKDSAKPSSSSSYHPHTTIDKRSTSLTVTPLHPYVPSHFGPFLSPSYVATLNEVMKMNVLKGREGIKTFERGEKEPNPSFSSSASDRHSANETSAFFVPDPDAPRHIPFPFPLPSLDTAVTTATSAHHHTNTTRHGMEGGEHRRLLALLFGTALSAWLDAFKIACNTTVSAASSSQKGKGGIHRPTPQSTPASVVAQTTTSTATTTTMQQPTTNTNTTLVDEALVEHLTYLLAARCNATHYCLSAWSSSSSSSSSSCPRVVAAAVAFGGQWMLTRRRMLLEQDEEKEGHHQTSFAADNSGTNTRKKDLGNGSSSPPPLLMSVAAEPSEQWAARLVVGVLSSAKPLLELPASPSSPAAAVCVSSVGVQSAALALLSLSSH